jgi:quaternary ammonium compound-resistance protein SugE
MVASMYLLALAARTLPIGTAYAVWVGIGAAGAMILGIALLGEPRTLARIACVGLIVAGVIGLKLVEPT